MSRAFLALALVVCVSLAAIAQEPKDSNIKRTVPTIEFGGFNPKDNYARTCNLSLNGRISRSLGWKQNVDFQFYQVLEGGDLYYQGGGSVTTDENGEFGASYLPSLEGWKPGKLRVYARVNGFPAVTGTAELNIAEEEIRLVNPSDLVRPAPKNSGVMIDTDDAKVKEYFVPVRASFRLRGTFPEARFRDVNVGIISVQIVKRELDGSIGKVIHQAGGGYVFREEDDTRWFEIEMESPRTSDWYHISIKPWGDPGKEFTPWEYDLHVGIEPDEKKDDKEDE